MLTTEPHGQHQPVGTAHRQRRQLPPHLAEELRLARLALGYSIRDVARLAGISSPFVSRLERGLRSPRVPVAVRLAKTLDLSDDVAEALLDEAVSDYQ